MPRKRILLLGNWVWDIYEAALARGLESIGAEVVPFRTLESGAPPINSWSGRLRPGFLLGNLNAQLLAAVERLQPDLIFGWRAIDILPSTWQKIRSLAPKSKIVLYHNDNPYDHARERVRCRHYLRSHRIADVVAVYRPANVRPALQLGAPRVEVFLSSYIRELHHPAVGGKFLGVSFVGHYEDDGRVEFIDALQRSGIPVALYGTNWHRAANSYEWLRGRQIQGAWGADYARVLSGSEVALTFLSARNRDVYTRRCFEIPACGSVLLAPRTDFLLERFEEGVEAEFWVGHDELVRKARYLLENPAFCARMAAAGRARVLRDGHDEYARARQVLDWFGW